MSLVFRKPEEKDKELFLSFLHKFYSSEAVLHPTDSALHLNIFREIIRSEDYLLCYIFSFENEDAGYALLSKSFCPEVGGSIIWIEQLYINEAFDQRELQRSFSLSSKRNFLPTESASRWKRTTKKPFLFTRKTVTAFCRICR